MQKNTIRKITMNDKRTDHNKNKAENHKLITEIPKRQQVIKRITKNYRKCKNNTEM